MSEGEHEIHGGQYSEKISEEERWERRRLSTRMSREFRMLVFHLESG